MKTLINESADFQIAGRVCSYQGVIRARLNASVGELCKIVTRHQKPIVAEVIGFSNEDTLLLPLRKIEALEPNAEIIALGRHISVPVGVGLRGRVLNGLCQPIDGLGNLFPSDWTSQEIESPEPLDRPPISEVFRTGQRSLDGLLTMGKGQRVGLFAGSGVGKSTLVGEIAKTSSADINVVALVGERGREVKPFIEDCLGPEGLARSIVIVATADETPLLRLYAAKSAIAVANWFRQQGHDVLLMVDSLTRLAYAQREIGLILGEPPTSRGYPPSALQLMAGLMEPLGCTSRGSITGLLSVLVEGDDTNEPVADTVRGVLDGHIVLSRKLAEEGHFPAISIQQSVSRLVNEITSPEHRDAIRRARAILATYDEVADLIRIGMYQPGTSERIDRAIALRDILNQFLRQHVGEASPFESTIQHLHQITSQWIDA